MKPAYSLERTIQAAVELLSPTQVETLETVRNEADAALRRLQQARVGTAEAAHEVQEGLVEVKRLLKTIEHERSSQLEPLAREEKAIRLLWSGLEEPLKKLDKEASRKVLVWMQQEDERRARVAAEARRRQEEAAQREQKLAAAAAVAPLEERPALEQQADLAGTDLAMARMMEPPEARVQALKGPSGGTSYRRPGPWCYKVVNGARPDWLAVAQAVLDEVTGALEPGASLTLSPALEALRRAIAQQEAAVPARYWCLDDKAIKAAIAGGARNIPGLAIWQEETLATRT